MVGMMFEVPEVKYEVEDVELVCSYQPLNSRFMEFISLRFQSFSYSFSYSFLTFLLICLFFFLFFGCNLHAPVVVWIHEIPLLLGTRYAPIVLKARTDRIRNCMPIL